jgi:hypothetical protein
MNASTEFSFDINCDTVWLDDNPCLKITLFSHLCWNTDGQK